MNRIMRCLFMALGSSAFIDVSLILCGRSLVGYLSRAVVFGILYFGFHCFDVALTVFREDKKNRRGEK